MVNVNIALVANIAPMFARRIFSMTAAERNKIFAKYQAPWKLALVMALHILSLLAMITGMIVDVMTGFSMMLILWFFPPYIILMAFTTHIKVSLFKAVRENEPKDIANEVLKNVEI